MYPCIEAPPPGNAGDELYLKTLDKALKQVDMRDIEVVAVSLDLTPMKMTPTSLQVSSVV